MINNLSKTILATVFMFGTIVPNDAPLIENDANFGSLAQELSSGWGWFKLSSAQASNYNCTSADECFGITGTPWDPWDPWPGGGDETGPGDCGFLSCNSDTGGDSGGGSPDPEPPKTGQKDQCLLNSNLTFNSCNTNAEIAWAGTALLCVGFAEFPPALAACEAAAYAALQLAKQDCADTKAVSDYECSKLPD